jgi:homoserine kinase
VGIGLHLKKGLPIGSGLGSSAASAVAAVMAANALLDEPFTKDELLPFALEGEAAVSGYHADNVAPALLGGMLLCNGTEIYQIRSLPVPENLHLGLVTPHVSVPTAEARAVLPEAVSLKTLVHQTGAVAVLIDAIYRGDVAEMARAMVQDAVIEPARAHLMPLLSDARVAAEEAGALGVVISGAGPTLCAVCDDGDACDAVVEAMHAVYHQADIGCDARHTHVIESGAQVLSVR